MKDPKNRGNAATIAVTVASTAIVLIVAAIVLGSLFTSAYSTLGSATTQNTTSAWATVSNITVYSWQAIVLMAVGLILAAGVGLISMLYKTRH